MSNLPSQTNDGNSSVVTVEIPSVIKKIQRVSPLFKKKKTHHGVYDPIIVSLGPYHHGKEQFNHAEAFKQVLLDGFVSESTGNNDKSFFHGKILKRIRDIRSCYEEVEYDDQALAWIILYDACFFIRFVAMGHNFPGNTDIFDSVLDYFGLGKLGCVYRDMYLLENQIPIWILKFLLGLQQGSTKLGQAIWSEMISKWQSMGKEILSHQSFHLLDGALRVGKVPVNTSPDISKIFNMKKTMNLTSAKLGCQYGSVTNLRKKGIRFKASTSQFSFTSHLLYGQLELLLFIDSEYIFDAFSNAIAYEMSSGIRTNLYTTSYVSFMKSLIDSPKDVNILREEGILYSHSASDDEIVRMFKNLDTFGLENYSIFWELRESIERHCSSKARTWMAELINTYFRSPWTVVALLAAFCALVLTFLQTFFTIHPNN